MNGEANGLATELFMIFFLLFFVQAISLFSKSVAVILLYHLFLNQIILDLFVCIINRPIINHPSFIISRGLIKCTTCRARRHLVGHI